ncbi:SGNH/GDSL hydrolase family protein [Terracoccus luteus]|uniref:Lysophospholipase L1-like esterase n=1 Tax=Terracoccus luteus TaxID=53356 RepID=A0A839Q166_9MICO|nr:SGNH/GDSL hydrolase family protein [Terracoccus luteus]MBB2987996.1 lysophospholipase L1-like esterase [Terracoccus luteus]MCP2173647.1 lysophospholipase L1-like esterase [Terracoccus luteus]
MPPVIRLHASTAPTSALAGGPSGPSGRHRRSPRLTRPMRWAAASVATLTGILGGAGLAGPPSAGAAGTAYVALGDSYSSGTGTRAYLDDGTSCQRSVYAYPALDAASLGLSLTFRACSGATVADVTSTQLSALSTSTSYVTISVGGNDAGFASVLTTCAQPSWLSNCNAAVDKAQAFVGSTLPSRLTTLYGSIRAKAPNARVVVVGYPRIFNGDDCSALTWFSASEESRLNATADLLNARTATAAAAAGFTFVNPTSVFTGHAVCDSPEWINNLSFPVSESFHPNRSGHASGYAVATRPAFGLGLTRTGSDAVRAAVASGPALVEGNARWAAVDRTVTPERFVAPDLTTPAARAAAARAGVDLGSRASIDRVDRQVQAQQDAVRSASLR